MLDFDWLDLAGLVHTVPATLSSFIQLYFCDWQILFHYRPLFPLALTVLPPSFSMVTLSIRGSCMTPIAHLKLSIPQFPVLCVLLTSSGSLC